ncbi:alpha/beta hydrolase family protein [Paramicrobacterium fandaimingii]|uniref:alpha/beta hydrolase family protein n=1 Tax=Paramicrobacterium fandaimingii TaxID=2708079 RepID=UPI001421D8F9|nr:alpha/beta fold hydrolase [Microbacterium fandaimingii]
MSASSIAELLDATRMNGLTATRAGRLIASATALGAEGNSYVSSLVELGDTGAMPLTRGETSASSPAITDDGHVLFVSKRIGEDGSEAKDGSLWSLPPRGEARQLASRPGGFGPLRTAGGVVVAQLDVHSQATSEKEHAELTKKRIDAKVSATLHSGFPTRYWDSDLGPARSVLAKAQLPGDLDEATVRPAPTSETEGESARQVLTFDYAEMPEGRLLDWDLSDDGAFALVVMQTSVPNILESEKLWRVDLRGGEPTLLIDADPADLESVEGGIISPDGTRAVIGRMTNWRSTQSMGARLQVLNLETKTVTELWPEFDFWADPVWLDDATIAAASDDAGRGSVWIGSLDDAKPKRLAGGLEQNLVFSSLAVQGSRLVASASGIDVAPHPVAIDPASGVVTALPNPATVLEAPGTLREVTATAEDGATVRAWLRLPSGDGPHPLVVFAHGGPWGSWNAWTYRWNPNPFVAAGYAVLLPDPAISTGYGQHMIDRGQHQLGGAPFSDIMALTDAAIARDDINASRTALAGGSYGGYMANWVAGQTGERFRCIVTHASLWDTEAMGSTTDNSGWDEPMRAQHELYSPHAHVADIRVPMLVIHGDKDYRVPIAQGQKLWYDLLTKSATPLDSNGQTQHRYLYFPDEGHWILGRGNAQVWYETFLAFLDTHVRSEQSERQATLG